MPRRAQQTQKWSQEVTDHSDALDLKREVFSRSSAEDIAESLKKSAQASPRRKASAFQSAMSMLTFYLNRGGRNLSASRKRVLNAAKEKLRQKFGRPQHGKN